MRTNWRMKLGDWLRAAANVLMAAVMVLVFVGFGLNSVIRISDTMPQNGAVVLLLDRSNGGWYRSIDSRSWGEFKEPPFADVLTRGEAEALGLKPFPDDVRDGLFHEECGLIQQLLMDSGVLPRLRRWIVLEDGVPTWDNGAVLSARDRRRLGME